MRDRWRKEKKKGKRGGGKAEKKDEERIRLPFTDLYPQMVVTTRSGQAQTKDLKLYPDFLCVLPGPKSLSEHLLPPRYV